jgi:hypothetical protein
VRVLGALTIVFLGQGCTTYLYKGPTRPSDQVAVITSDDTIVDSVDGVRVTEDGSGSYANLELLPGPHSMTVGLNRVMPGSTFVQRSQPVEICVQLQPGRRYVVVPVLEGSIFLPQVLDVATRSSARRCGAPQRPVAAAALPASPAEADPGAPPMAAPPPSAGSTTDDGAPPAATATGGITSARPHLPSDAVLANRHPGNGLSLALGGAFGGEDFVKASYSNGDETSLSSGAGLILGVGAMLTPLWAGDVAGFGLSANASLKHDSLNADNGSASIMRYPIALTGHVLLNVSNSPHYLLFKGGVGRDFGVHYTASGFVTLDAHVPATWGPTGSFGYYKKSNDTFAWDILGFFALTNHVVGVERISANSFGVTAGVHWLL